MWLLLLFNIILSCIYLGVSPFDSNNNDDNKLFVIHSVSFLSFDDNKNPKTGDDDDGDCVGAFLDITSIDGGGNDDGVCCSTTRSVNDNSKTIQSNGFVNGSNKNESGSNVGANICSTNDDNENQTTLHDKWYCFHFSHLLSFIVL